jgi:peptidoglycan/LPS O-acetylase OafA/YrhL
VVLTLLMALLSYYAIEKPFLRRARVGKVPTPAPALAVT